jgi:hypothetical protein
MEYVCTRYQSNKDRYRRGFGPERIQSPYEYAHWSDAQFEDFYSHSDINKTRAVIVGGSYAFLLAHEVAHHIHGDVDKPSKNDAEQRTRESAADDWAIDLLIHKNISPVCGIVPLLFFY